MPGAQAVKHTFAAPEAAVVAKPEGQMHCSCAPELNGMKFGLQVQLDGPPVADEPSGQAVHVKTVGEPVWKKLSAQAQYCEPAFGATAPGVQLVQAVPPVTTAA